MLQLVSRVVGGKGAYMPRARGAALRLGQVTPVVGGRYAALEPDVPCPDAHAPLPAPGSRTRVEAEPGPRRHVVQDDQLSVVSWNASTLTEHKLHELLDQACEDSVHIIAVQEVNTGGPVDS